MAKKTFQELVRAGVERAPIQRVRAHHISAATALATVAPLIIEDCIRQQPIYVKELSLESGIAAPTLGMHLGRSEKGVGLWDIPRVSEKKPRIIRTCRENALIMMGHLSMAGAVMLQERLGMSEAEIYDAIMKLPVAADN